MAAKTSRAKIDKFLDLLAEGRTIVHAAREVGVARSTLYGFRETDATFRAAWEEALEAGVALLEEEARRLEGAFPVGARISARTGSSPQGAVRGS